MDAEHSIGEALDCKPQLNSTDSTDAITELEPGPEPDNQALPLQQAAQSGLPTYTEPQNEFQLMRQGLNSLLQGARYQLPSYSVPLSLDSDLDHVAWANQQEQTEHCEQQPLSGSSHSSIRYESGDTEQQQQSDSVHSSAVLQSSDTEQQPQSGTSYSSADFECDDTEQLQSGADNSSTVFEYGDTEQQPQSGFSQRSKGFLSDGIEQQSIECISHEGLVQHSAGAADPAEEGFVTEAQGCTIHKPVPQPVNSDTAAVARVAKSAEEGVQVGSQGFSTHDPVPQPACSDSATDAECEITGNALDTAPSRQYVSPYVVVQIRSL